MPTTQPDAIGPDNFDRLWDWHNPGASEEKFREQLIRAERDHELPYRIELLTQIARTHSLRRQFDQSNAILDRAQKLLGDDETKLVRPRVRYLLERGRAFNSSDHPDQARPLFLRALDLASASKLDDLAIDAAHMMGIAETDSHKQLEWNKKALAMAEASSDAKAKRWLPSLYNNTGWCMFELKQYGPALEIFQKAVQLRADADPPQPRELRVAKYAVGRTLREIGRTNEALEIQRSIHAEAQAANDTDPYVCAELAELLTIKGDEANAAAFAKTAYDMLSKDDWSLKHDAKQIERLKKLSNQ